MAEITRVPMVHPKIDGGERVREVPAAAVDHYVRSGWQIYEAPAEQDAPPPPTDPQTPEAPETSGASPLPDQTPQRRRAQKDGE